MATLLATLAVAAATSAKADDQDRTEKESHGRSRRHASARQSSTDDKDTPTPSQRNVPAVSPKTPSDEAERAEPSGSRGINEKRAAVASLKPEEIKEFSNQPPKLQAVLREALALTDRNLVYTYGSDDPANGGMDCSGFVSYVLQKAGCSDVPRDSSGQYVWVCKHNEFHALLSQDPGTLTALKPGDLLFWSGTYTIKRDVPITHVMIYLGTSKETNKPLMVGASEGRSYEGVRRFGVSVFDFKLPTGQPASDDPGRTPKFEGYATIPGLRTSNLVNNQPVVQPSPTPRSHESLSDGN